MKLPIVVLRLLDPFRHQAALVLFVLSTLGTYSAYNTITANTRCFSCSTVVVQAFGFNKFHSTSSTISPGGCARPTTTTTSTRVVPLFRTRARCTTATVSTTSFGRIYRSQAAASGSNNEFYPNDSSNDDNRRDVIENMRHYLESSWNSQTMGRVPSTPENAAEAAAQSIQSAKGDGIQHMMVNILLPSYDITQGEQFYDEILAAQFCISLSKYLQDLLVLSSCTILLRNGKAERFARRVLMTTNDESKTQIIQQDDNNNDTDFDGIEDTVNETERFRQKLLRLEASTAWEGGKLETHNDNIEPQTSTEANAAAAEELEQEQDNNDKEIIKADGTGKKAYVQLSSLLGDGAISKGTDMADDVIQAVMDRFRESASRASKDEAIIILSSFSPEDMVAVRRVMQLYEGSETLFVLVNCKLNPIPRELLRSEVVYSLLPLTVIERAPQPTWMNKQQQNQENDNDNTIKVIVLRRYPQGWEIFVDRNGSGFTLASTVNANPMERNGPTMERIAAVVEHHLKQSSRLGRTLKQQEEDDDDDNILQ